MKKYFKLLLLLFLELSTPLIVFFASYTLIEMTIVLNVAGADSQQIHYYLNSIVIVCYIFIKIILFLIERYIIKEEIIDET